MKKLFLLLALLLLCLTSCATTYHIERTSADGTSTRVDVKSTREFPGGIEIFYNRENGTFELKAGDVENGTAGVERILEKIVMSLIPVQ